MLLCNFPKNPSSDLIHVLFRRGFVLPADVSTEGIDYLHLVT
jgi:hypothetical protein